MLTKNQRSLIKLVIAIKSHLEWIIDHHSKDIPWQSKKLIKRIIRQSDDGIDHIVISSQADFIGMYYEAAELTSKLADDHTPRSIVAQLQTQVHDILDCVPARKAEDWNNILEGLNTLYFLLDEDGSDFAAMDKGEAAALKLMTAI